VDGLPADQNEIVRNGRDTTKDRFYVLRR